MLRKMTRLERIGWWIVDRIGYWLENESDRQFIKQAKRRAKQETLGS